MRYFANLFIVAKTLAEAQMTMQPLRSRFYTYRSGLSQYRLSSELVQRYLHDIALTIRVHPWALGIKPNSDGAVYVPPRVWIRVNLSVNIMRYNRNGTREERRQSQKMATLTPGVHPTEAMIHDLKVKKEKTVEIRAVIVTEHKNLDELIKYSPLFHGVIAVFTSGFPSGATSEFLHMLANELVSVPFMYFTDHDLEGSAIFAALKYGSRAMTWASKIQNCPRLTWVGPTVDNLLEAVDDFRDTWIADCQANHPRATQDDVDARYDTWRSVTTDRLKGRFIRTTAADRTRYKGFENAGWLEHEPKLHEQIKRMLNDEKIRFAYLADVDLMCPARFLAQRIEELSTVAAPTMTDPEISGSQRGTLFQQLDSESQAVQPEVTTEQLQMLEQFGF